MHVVIVINKPAWSVGTLARLIQLGGPPAWTIRLVAIGERECDTARLEALVGSPDVVHWMIHRHFPEGTPFVRNGRHVVSVLHLESDEPALSPLAMRDAHRIHVLSDECRQAFLSGGWNEGRVVRIPIPVDDTFLRAGAMRRRDRPRADTGVFRIGFFSAADYNSLRKRIDLLPAVSQRLSEAGVEHEFVVTGLGWAEQLRLGEFAGVPVRHAMVPSYFDMHRIYRRLDAYLCLSRVEGGPMPVFEALASGVPAVSTAVGAVRDYLHAGREFSQIPFDDADAAANALLWVRSQREAAAAQVESARRLIQSELTLGHFQQAFMNLYSELAGGAIERTAPQGLLSRLQRRRWRAWDRSYWAKEMWSRGRMKEALRLMAASLVLDPFGAGIWRTPGGVLRRLRSLRAHAAPREHEADRK